MKFAPPTSKKGEGLPVDHLTCLRDSGPKRFGDKEFA